MTEIVRLTIDLEVYGEWTGKLGEPFPAYIDLPADLVWSDYGWADVDQEVTRAGDGTAIIQQSQYIGGRPVTLESGAHNAWILTPTVLALENTLVAGLQMGLTWNTGEIFTVIWRFQERPTPFVWQPVRYVVPKPDSMRHLITLKLQTI